jgi:thymidine phosphorylase
VLLAKVGDHLRAGEPLVEVHARTKEQAELIRDQLLSAYGWSEEPPATSPLILDSVGL